MARNQSAIGVWGQYLGLRAAGGFMQCFDVEQNLHTAASIGSIFCKASPKRRQRAERNIALSFPEYAPQQVAEVARRSIQYMFQLFLVESLATPRLITPASWPKFVRLGNLQPALERFIRGQPVIMVTGHCGNWELLGYVLAVLGYPLCALARPLDNPLINRWLLGIREARGMRIITKWGATQTIQEVLHRGGRLGFIADQNAGEQGLFVPFFGRLASSYKSIGLLAMRHDVPVITGHARRLGPRLEYEVSCTDAIMPQDWADQPDPLFYITARYNRAIEQMIRRAPEQYLWVHRRWKSRPRHERLGKPLSARMIAKLEQLPWMTDDELDLIVHRSNEAARENAARAGDRASMAAAR